MKVRNVIPIITSVILAIVLVIMACTQAAVPKPTTLTPLQQPTTATITPTNTPTTTPTPQVIVKAPTYRALNPQGSEQPVQISPLAPRLDTFDGKTIYVRCSESDPVIMPALWDKLKKDNPKTTFKWMNATTAISYDTIFGGSGHLTATKPEDEVLKNAKAVIMGVAW